MDSPSPRANSSDEDLMMMDQRKRKRMESNRESARRSRMRKQKHLDDQTYQINRLKNDNKKIVIGMEVSRLQFLQIEAQNSVLRAQIGELSQRLDSMNEIMKYINDDNMSDDLLNHQPWNMMMYVNQHLIMASASDVLQY